MKLTKRRIFETLEKGEGDDKLSKRFDVFIMSLILINVASVILETVDSFSQAVPWLFYYIEVVSVTIFTIEYIGRVWTCTYFEKYSHPFWGRIRYMLSFEGVIDLLAILPFYLPIFFSSIDGRFLRILRLARLLRLFKMGRYSTAFQLIVSVVKKRKEELMITFTIILIMLIFASSMMYYVENEAQPEAFSSIPQTMWWGVATLTTVGYGDMYPISPMGKMLGAFIAILGVGIFALPAGIIAAGFEYEIRNRSKKNEEE